MEHPDDAVLLKYVTEQMSEQDLLDIASHVEGCEECLWRVRGLRHLRAHFDDIWDSWSFETHGHLYRQWQMAEALAKREAQSGWDDRRLLALFDRGALVTVRCALGLAEEGVRTLAEAMPPGYRLCPEAAAAGVGDIDTPEEERDVPSIAQDLLYEGKRTGQFAVEGQRREVRVKYWPQENAALPVSVLLIYLDGSSDYREALFKAVEGTDYFLAEFFDLAEKEYVVVLMPDVSA